MKTKIFNKDGAEQGSVDLPVQFSTVLRKDVIKRAVEVIEANNRQRYGAKPDAGMRASAKLSRRRHDYRGGYGSGISRVPRKIMSRRGTRMNWVAAVAPGTVGGRRAHPPKATKMYDQKINTKENRLAIRSAIAATIDKELVSERGHKVPEHYPFVVDDSFTTISKTKDLSAALDKLGFTEEQNRTQAKKVRAGRGKTRGRKYNTKTGLLIVTAGASALDKACSNIPGFETRNVSQLNAKILAPGGVAGRMTLFTTSALEKLNAEKLYTEDKVKPVKAVAKPEKKADAKPAVKAEPKKQEATA